MYVCVYVCMCVCIVNILFPIHELANERQQKMVSTKFLSFPAEELKVAAVGLRPGKAPGPDGVPPKVIREIASQRPELLLRIYNNLQEKLTSYQVLTIWRRFESLLLFIVEIVAFLHQPYS